ncbi:retinoid-inducible serine carboxypeptidase-like [Diprion similis]|uniref:retinoid-inducible serine carboxypeptidase-like n=1 Tax=Diprion similis TaxID=362088 RepID=UPI001EF94001|nr:retinoid-inducible serine carboxypeptidase-like [Diprion similis]
MILPTITVITLTFLATGVNGRQGFGSGEQEWGYVTVRPYAHMFWWLYYTTANVTNFTEKPLIIWLQGGPGASSTGYGNFEELGPLDLDLNERNYSWVNDYNVLFIDNPVGSGFSYAEKYSGYPKTNAAIASDLLACIKGFLTEFPAFATVPTYITAESYGGKMAAEFAYVWYKAQTNGIIESTLKGVAMGDSWLSPMDSVNTWAPYLLSTGMVDTIGYEKIKAAAKKTQDAVDDGRWSDATSEWGITEYVIINVANNIDFYNILYKVAPSSRSSAREFAMDKALLRDERDDQLDELMNGVVKEALGLNVTWGAQSNTIFSALYADFMKPATDQVEYLLNDTDINIFVFTAQLDLIVDTPGTILWVERLKWPNATQWLNSSRDPLVIDSVIEGYVKQDNNFKLYWINRSGHMVPTDNPVATAAMLEDLTSNANS